MPDYRVQTDIYNGPMDLLLYLIRRNEVDLYDIPIARITVQYYQYVEALSVIDPNVAGDFLVMAAVLMEMKSRMLLPRAVGPEGEPEDLSDPRLELVRQLLEYKRFKDASFELRDAAHWQSMRWPRMPVKHLPAGPPEVDLEEVQIWDLVAAFNKLMASIGGRAVTHDVVFDDTPVALHATDILHRLQGEGGELLFEDIFAGRNRIEMIGLFLALLELMRQQRIRITQPKAFGPIKITLLSAEPIEVGEEWGPAFREAVLGQEHAPEPGSAEEATKAEPDRVKEEARTPDAAGMPTEDEDEDEGESERFEELERIKTEVDIEAVLRQADEESLAPQSPVSPGSASAQEAGETCGTPDGPAPHDVDAAKGVP
jgi:segregation and condensation protein A